MIWALRVAHTSLSSCRNVGPRNRVWLCRSAFAINSSVYFCDDGNAGDADDDANNFCRASLRRWRSLTANQAWPHQSPERLRVPMRTVVSCLIFPFEDIQPARLHFATTMPVKRSQFERE